MNSTNRKFKLLLIKYLLIAGALSTIGIVLATVSRVTFIGEIGSGYSTGISVNPIEIAKLGLQVFCSLTIAYFMGTRTVNAINQGQNMIFVGVKSLLICWTAPWVLINLISATLDQSWEFMLINVIVAIIPPVIIGPIVGRAMKKKIMK